MKCTVTCVVLIILGMIISASAKRAGALKVENFFDCVIGSLIILVLPTAIIGWIWGWAP